MRASKNCREDAMLIRNFTPWAVSLIERPNEALFSIPFLTRNSLFCSTILSKHFLTSELFPCTLCEDSEISYLFYTLMQTQATQQFSLLVWYTLDKGIPYPLSIFASIFPPSSHSSKKTMDSTVNGWYYFS